MFEPIDADKLLNPEPQDMTEQIDFYKSFAEKHRQAKLEYERRCQMAFEAISDKDMAAIVAGSRNRGVYKQELGNLNGETMVQVSLTEGVFAGKSATTVATGFRNAIEKNEEFKHLRVIHQGDNVYIHNTAA